MQFDVEGAKKAGYSDVEIADAIAARANFDATGARKAGFTDEQIIGRLTMRDAMPAEPKPQGFGARLSQGIKDTGRQLGLTARYAMEGPAEAVGAFTEPARFAIEKAWNGLSSPSVSDLVTGQRTKHVATPRELATTAADFIGLPKPETPQERIVGEASRMVAGSGALGGVATQVANRASGVVRSVANQFAAAPAQQAAGAAGAGAAGEYAKETGGDPLAQFVASVAGGLAGAGGAAGVERLAGAVQRGIAAIRSPRTSVADITIRLDSILRDNGVSLNQVPAALRGQLVEEARRALDTGTPINPDVVRRIADYGVVGATPTRGTVTLDPVTITRERNLAKVGANMSDEASQRLSRVQNENNARLIAALNETGAAGPFARQRVAAGDAITGAVQSRDAAAQAVERSLYEQARNTAGRDIPLDREAFVHDAYRRLAEQNAGAFLPDNIGRLLEQIRAGRINLQGQDFEVPFNVDVIQNLKTTLATASRGAGDGNTRRALSLVRQALEDTPIQSRVPQTGSALPAAEGQLAGLQQQGDELSGEAMRAFDRARRFARARRQWQESAPGIGAALDDTSPDRFVQDFIVGEGGRASYQNVAQLVRTLRRDPQAIQAARERITGFLKEGAIGRGTADEVGNFSPAGFNRALDQIGEDKLRLFFSPEEISQLRTIGRVASYETVQPRGSAVNNSNTAAGMAGLLERIASSPLLGRVPFGGVALQEPARNWSAQIRSTQALTPLNALAAQATERRPRNALLPYLALPMIAQPE